MKTYFDIPWLMADLTKVNATEENTCAASKVKAFLNIPVTEKPSDIIRVRRAQRQDRLFRFIPVLAVLSESLDPAFEHVFSLFDF